LAFHAHFVLLLICCRALSDLKQVLCRFIQSTDLTLLHSIMFGNYCRPNVFDICLQTMTESTWKNLKLDWKTFEFFFFQKSGNTEYVLK